MRALALIAALVCASASAAGPRNMNVGGQGGHLNVPLSGVILRLPLTASGMDECSGASIPGVTFTRSSSATCTKSDGTVVTLSANQPRVTAAGLLIEGGATNLALRSDALATSPWAVDASVVVTADQGVAPDGTMSADLVDNTAATNLSGNYQSVTVSSSAGPFTYSVYAAKQSGTGAAGIVAICGGGVTVSTCACDREDGTTCNATTSGSQCRVYSTHSTTPKRIALHVTCASAVTSVLVSNVAGQPGTSTGKSLFWGTQLETGSIATSYIPTAGTSAARTADLATVATPVALNTSEGCAKVCVTPLWTGAPAMEGRILDADLTTSNARLLYAPASVDAVRSYNGTTFPAVTAGFTVGTQRCYVARWSVAANSLKVERIDNSTSNSVAFGGFPSFDSTIGLGSRTNGASPVNGTIANVQFGRTSGACQ